MAPKLGVLEKRQKIVEHLREYLRLEGFLELHAPCLVKGTCPDSFIESFDVGSRYLTTSTEYHIKRLLASGATRVYTMQSNFRAGDVGSTHNPEFMMLEWGRVGASLRDIEADLEQMILRAAQSLHGDVKVVLGNGEFDFSPPYKRLSVAEGFETELGVGLGGFSQPELLGAAQHLDIDVPVGCEDDPVALFSLLVDRLQLRLGQEKPVWLTEWPAFLGSSVAITQHGTVERSELMIRGVELCDGFPFVTDAHAQRARFEAANRDRRRNGVREVVIDEEYLTALGRLPSGAGMALGVDRLVMVLLALNEIRDVLAFPWDEL